MDKADILEAPDLHRRRFLSGAAMALAAAELGVIRSARAQVGRKINRRRAPTRLLAPSSRSTPATSMSDMSMPVRLTGLQSSSCTGGHTTFTASSMSRPC